MKQMSQQKRLAVSGLDEKSSPFVPTKTQEIFKNSANLQLRGNTYDANHLDRFLNSNYGEKSLGTNLTTQFEANLKKQMKVEKEE